MSVIDRDKGIKGLLKRLADSASVITVGVHADAGPETKGTSVAAVATFQEFGTEHIPARSFLRSWADENASQINDTIRKVGQGVVKGKYTAKVGLMRAGALFVGQIQAKIASNIGPPLDPRTIARKGSSVSLINTGTLRSSVAVRLEGA